MLKGWWCEGGEGGCEGGCEGGVWVRDESEGQTAAETEKRSLMPLTAPEMPISKLMAAMVLPLL